MIKVDKRIDGLYDSITKVKYDLCYLSLIDLHRELVAQYGMTIKELNMFNSDEWEVEKYNNGDGYSEDKNEANHYAYEQFPMAISLKNKSFDNIESIQLLDGFRRMFYVNEIPDIKVLVKVYDTLTDLEWSNSMLIFNSWKISQRHQYEYISFFDRGYKLSLYKRYGINIPNYKDLYERDTILSYFRSRGIFHTHKNNPCVAKDLKLSFDLNEYFNNRQGGRGEIYIWRLIIQHFIEILGETRYKTTNGGDEYIDVEGEDFHNIINIINPNVLNKILGMSGNAHTDNRIKKDLVPIFKEYLDNKKEDNYEKK